MNALALELAMVEKIRAEIPDIIAIYVFGSTAAGQSGPNSDLDLAILRNMEISAHRLWSLAQLLAVTAGRDVDLLDLQSASTVMRAQVVSKGNRLYCDNAVACGEFEDRVYAEYARLNEERRYILEDINVRGRVYG